MPKKKSLLLLLYQLWKTAKFRSFSLHCKCKTVQPLMLWVTKVFVTCVRLQLQPKIFQKINLERKNQNFWFMGKHLSDNFYIWKNAYHRVFIQFSVSMELYEIVWQEVSHIWKLYDKKFWSTRAFSILLARVFLHCVHYRDSWSPVDRDKGLVHFFRITVTFSKLLFITTVTVTKSSLLFKNDWVF